MVSLMFCFREIMFSASSFQVTHLFARRIDHVHILIESIAARWVGYHGGGSMAILAGSIHIDTVLLNTVFGVTIRAATVLAAPIDGLSS